MEKNLTTGSVFKNILFFSLPYLLSYFLQTLYGMADLFIIGQFEGVASTTAVSIGSQVMHMLTVMIVGLAMGSTVSIGQAVGAGDRKKAGQTAVFCIWSSIAVSLCYGILLMMICPILLPAVGANEETYEFCRQYVFWTIAVGAIPTVLNQELAHLVRAEGHSAQASFGMALGGVLNIILDPIFIFPLKLEIAGAAIATMLSNAAASLYFAALIFRSRKETVIRFDPRLYPFHERIPREVLLVGLPSCLMNLMGVLSNVTLNKLLAGYSNAAIAGIGVAKKVDMMTFAISTGMSQGVLPLIGYNYSASNFRRMRSALKTSFLFSFTVAAASTIFLFTCAGPIVHAFIDDAETVRYGQLFQRIICITGPCISITMLTITSFQSVGKKLEPAILSLLRKGGLDIPFMFLMNALAGVDGIVWATPIADFLAMIAALILLIPFLRKLPEDKKAAA